MESRTVAKIIGAFLAGVFLALGAAILHSRQGGMTNAVQSSHVSAASAISASQAEASKGDLVREQTIQEHRSLPPSEPAEPQSAPVASQKLTRRAERSKEAQSSARMASLRPDPVVSPPAEKGPLSTSVAPAIVPFPPENASVNAVPNARAGLDRTPPITPAPNPVSSQEPHVVTLPAGTTLTVRLGETLSSDRNNDGDTFQGTLNAPVIANGFVIAERQSRVVGRVVDANRAGRVKGLANLELAVSEINTTDGQRVLVETDSYEKWGNSSVKGDTAKVAGVAALGAIIGAIAGGGRGAAIGAGAGGAAGTGIALGTRGVAASVPSESILTFRLSRPVTITEKFN